MSKLLTPFVALRLLFQLGLFSSRVILSLIPLQIWFLVLFIGTVFGSTQFVFDHLPHTDTEEIATMLTTDKPSLDQDIDYYRQLSQLQPTHRDILYNLSKLLEQQQDPTAEYLYDQAVTIDPLLEL